MNKITVSQEGSEKLREAYEKLCSTLEFGEEMDVELKQEYEARIQSKLENGKKLSQKELRYLQKYNPVMYMHAMRIQMQREALQKRLENARSKQEIEQIQAEAIAAVGKDDPVRKYMVAMVQDTVQEFKKTDAYKRLPEKDEKEHKKDCREVAVCKKTEADVELLALKYETQPGGYQVAFVAEDVDGAGFSVSQ